MANQDNKLTEKTNDTAASKSSSGSMAGTATATAKSFYDQAKETAGQAYEAVTDKAANALDDKKATLSDGLSTVADSIRQAGENIGRDTTTENTLADAVSKYSDAAAEKIQSVAGYFDRKDVRDMARDLEGFARRNPAIFIGAAFGLGLLAARFLKSSAPYGDERSTGQNRRQVSGRTAANDVESGQGLQMADQNFEPAKKNNADTASRGKGPQTGTAGSTGNAAPNSL